MTRKPDERPDNNYFTGARDDHWDVQAAPMTPEHKREIIEARKALAEFKKFMQKKNK